MVSEMLKMFSIEKDGSKPLYLQLRQKIINYINVSEIGDKLPSERSISEMAGVNRETVRNSLKEFIRMGVLKREKYGTIINARIEDEDNQEFHPLLAGQFSELSAGPAETVKLSLYETLPNQRKFWNEAVESFNATRENIRTEIEWINHKVSNKTEYLAYIRETQPDMFLLNNDSCDFFAKEDTLCRIPETFREKIDRKQFLKGFYAYNDPRNDYSVPFHFSPWVIIWNLELAEKLGVKVPENIQSSSVLPKFFSAISGKIPDRFIATGNVWNLLVSMGIPQNSHPGIKFFKRRFSALAPFVHKYGNIFSVTQENPFETLERFSRGEMLCYIGSLFFVLRYMEGFSFDFRGEWLIPEEGCCYKESPSRIGVSAQTENTENVFLFIEHLFTENIQKSIIHKRLNCSYHKKADRELEKNIKGLKAEKLDDVLTHYIPFPSNTWNTENFLTFEIRDLYHKMLEGQIDIPRAAETAHKKSEGIKIRA